MSEFKTNNENLNELLKKCEKYTSLADLEKFDVRGQTNDNNNAFVYKLIVDDTKNSTGNCENWLVVMKKLEDTTKAEPTQTKTNENRSNVIDENYAKFRADKLKVVEIINVDNPKITRDKIVNKFKFDYDMTLSVNNETIYEVDKITECKYYDDDIDVVCSHGIHYFKTLVPAFYLRVPPANYTGVWIKWYDNGAKMFECCLQDGELSGLFTEFFDNKQIMSEGYYLNGLKTGFWTDWDIFGLKVAEGYYHGGKKIGFWNYWFEHDDGLWKFRHSHEDD